MQNISLSRENLEKLLQAANIEVDPTVLTGFANALQFFNPNDIINALSQTGSSVTPENCSTTSQNQKEEKVNEKPLVEESESSDDDMGFGLFD